MLEVCARSITERGRVNLRKPLRPHGEVSFRELDRRAERLSEGHRDKEARSERAVLIRTGERTRRERGV
jgi:hypothetical protein